MAEVRGLEQGSGRDQVRAGWPSSCGYPSGPPAKAESYVTNRQEEMAPASIAKCGTGCVRPRIMVEWLRKRG